MGGPGSGPRPGQRNRAGTGKGGSVRAGGARHIKLTKTERHTNRFVSSHNRNLAKGLIQGSGRNPGEKLKRVKAGTRRAPRSAKSYASVFKKGK